MENKTNILKPFFENPSKGFYIRELSRMLKINHTTIRQYLNKLVKENYLTLEKSKLYSSYRLNQNEKKLNLKLFYNMEKLRMSGIIKDLEHFYEFPVIVLFGSYAKATDDETSDIDIAIFSDINKEFDTHKYQKILDKMLSIHLLSGKLLKNLKKSNPGIINNICNGIILSGKLEVL